MTSEAFADEAPDDDGLTEYDHAHMVLYLRLLDSATDGADWREAVEVLFGLDPDKETARARQVYDTHLARARWMTHTGYRHLVAGRVH